MINNELHITSLGNNLTVKSAMAKEAGYLIDWHAKYFAKLKKNLVIENKKYRTIAKMNPKDSNIYKKKSFFLLFLKPFLFFCV
jgi:hypothetical protein